MNGEPQRIRPRMISEGSLPSFMLRTRTGCRTATRKIIAPKRSSAGKLKDNVDPEAKADFAAQAEQKRYARKQAERELYEATAKRLVEELQINNSGVSQTAYHNAKEIEATPGAPSRNGDVLVPG